MLFTYLILLIFEGVFRKWIHISSVDIFYILRDALLLVGIARIHLTNPVRYLDKLFWVRIYVLVIIVLASLQFFLINMNLTVFILGVRNYLAPIGLLYFVILAQKKDALLLLLNRTIIPITLTETILVILQVISPRNGFINATPTGNDAIVTSGLQVRPLGTFTSSLGLVYFLIFAFSFCIYQLEYNSSPKYYFLLALILVNTLLSGSRTAPASILFIGLVFILRHYRKRENRSHLISGLLLVFTFAAIVVQTVFHGVWEAYLFRIMNQTEGSSGTANRVLQAFGQFSTSNLSFLGDGIGVHHASAIPFYGLSTWIESENLRWAGELGLTGYFLFNLRVFIAIYLLLLVLFARKNQPNFPLIIGFIPMLVVGGISTQPTIQGMASLTLATVMSVNHYEKQRNHV